MRKKRMAKKKSGKIHCEDFFHGTLNFIIYFSKMVLKYFLLNSYEEYNMFLFINLLKYNFENSIYI